MKPLSGKRNLGTLSSPCLAFSEIKILHRVVILPQCMLKLRKKYFTSLLLTTPMTAISVCAETVCYRYNLGDTMNGKTLFYDDEIRVTHSNLRIYLIYCHPEIPFWGVIFLFTGCFLLGKRRFVSNLAFKNPSSMKFLKNSGSFVGQGKLKSILQGL